MRIVLTAETGETPTMLSPRKTYTLRFTIGDTIYFFVTHFQYRHMDRLRELWRAGYQVQFPCYETGCVNEG